MAETTSPSPAVLGELIGSCGLLMAVVGSGIMAERLAGGQAALALLANSLATGAALYALIAVLGPLSGPHFNPAVTLLAWWSGAIDTIAALARVAAQLAGAIGGVLLAHAMFGESILQLSATPRGGAALILSEVVATLGLLLVVHLTAHRPASETAAAVATYITGAYWFTASTSFANPAVTLARCLTDSFTGIQPQDAAGFLVAQFVAVVLARVAVRVLPVPAT